jgi:hypothetical protein
MTTAQEEFWAGEFGNDYVDRNQGSTLLANRTASLARALAHMAPLGSALDLGSNIGLNLHALRRLVPQATLSAVEINQKAADVLAATLSDVDLHRCSLHDFVPARTWDLVLISARADSPRPRPFARCLRPFVSLYKSVRVSVGVRQPSSGRDSLSRPSRPTVQAGLCG